MTTEILSTATPADCETSVRRAADILKHGGLVVFPTETVYGLGGNGLDGEAAQKIFSAKGRAADNPLILHVAAPSDASLYAKTSPLFDRLAEAFMPGPLTVILPARSGVPKAVTAGLDTVAIRCPAHPLANALIRACGFPIAAPSANLSGSPSPTCFCHVADDMLGRVDAIIAGDDSEIGLESTIVKILPGDRLLLLRPGAITPEDLKPFCLEITVADAVFKPLETGEKPLSPGMKYKHYAPKTDFVLLDGDADSIKDYLLKQPDKIALLSYEEELPFFSALSNCTTISAGPKTDLSIFAHRLFSLLRIADGEGYQRIFAPLPPPVGIGLALYNRMIRAAAYQIIQLKSE